MKTPRVHHAARWRGGRMAGRGAGAAAVYAGHRVPRQRNSQTVGAPLMGAFLEGLSEAEIVVGRDVTACPAPDSPPPVSPPAARAPRAATPLPHRPGVS